VNELDKKSNASERNPVQVGDELDGRIEAIGGRGDGIIKKEGFVIFVPNTKLGDNVVIKIVKVLNKVGFGEIISVKEERELE